LVKIIKKNNQFKDQNRLEKGKEEKIEKKR
jgi:hypothetical protein